MSASTHPVDLPAHATPEADGQNVALMFDIFSDGIAMLSETLVSLQKLVHAQTITIDENRNMLMHSYDKNNYLVGKMLDLRDLQISVNHKLGTVIEPPQRRHPFDDDEVDENEDVPVSDDEQPQQASTPAPRATLPLPMPFAPPSAPTLVQAPTPAPTQARAPAASPVDFSSTPALPEPSASETTLKVGVFGPNALTPSTFTAPLSSTSTNPFRAPRFFSSTLGQPNPEPASSRGSPETAPDGGNVHDAPVVIAQLPKEPPTDLGTALEQLRHVVMKGTAASGPLLVTPRFTRESAPSPSASLIIHHKRAREEDAQPEAGPSIPNSSSAALTSAATEAETDERPAARRQRMSPTPSTPVKKQRVGRRPRAATTPVPSPLGTAPVITASPPPIASRKRARDDDDSSPAPDAAARPATRRRIAPETPPRMLTRSAKKALAETVKREDNAN